METLTIEKGVPLPKVKVACWKNLASRMEVGDSVLCADARKALMLYNALRYINCEGLTRKETNGFRVWRIS